MSETLRLTPAEILKDNIRTEAAARRRSERLKFGTVAPGGSAVIGREGRADLVVWESAERFMATPPKA